jgi:thymidylate synthase (FAD)
VKIITEPKVTLVSFPSYTPHPVYQLPPHEQAGENIIAMAGKVCYDSYGLDGNAVERHIKTLVDSGHHSVLEHVHVGLFIEGISRGCSHEIVRHRMFNYSQRSTRYTAEDDAAIVLDPYYADIYLRSNEPGYPVVAREVELLKTFLYGCEGGLAAYRRSVELLSGWSEDSREQQGIPLNPRDYRKWCRGKARQLLPHAAETRMVMTGNLRAWRHFLVMRSSRHAEAEIRRLAAAVWAIIRPLAPSVFADMIAEDVGGFVEVIA